MSSSDDPPKDATHDDACSVNEMDENQEAELISMHKHLLTRAESGFAGIIKEIFQHLGKDFADGTLKSLLECPICKEIMIGTVSRKCTHSFCHHCLADWLKRSTSCPICRDECYLAVKNPLLEQFIDLFVDLSFSEDEKSERAKLIQQRLMPSSDAIEEHAAFLRSAILDPSLDTSHVARNVCVMNAQSLFVQILTSDQLKQMLNIDELSNMRDLSISFVDDVKSLELLLNCFSQSMKARYITFPFPS